MKLINLLERKRQIAVTVPGTVNVATAVKTMFEHRVGAVVVPSESGDPLGILSERDVVRNYAQGMHDFESMLVKDYMTKEVVVGHPDDDVDSVMATMSEKRFRHMPVIQDGKIIGVVSMGDLVKCKLEETAQEAQALRDYINS